MIAPVKNMVMKLGTSRSIENAVPGFQVKTMLNQLAIRAIMYGNGTKVNAGPDVSHLSLAAQDLRRPSIQFHGAAQ